MMIFKMCKIFIDNQLVTIFLMKKLIKTLGRQEAACLPLRAQIEKCLKVSCLAFGVLPV